ncbi:PTS sugar transporter subunit IIA [Mesomycoplasma lagogenitalium]|uniref:Mannitol-specific phosphotransferase enzyme IIA component n=1 Tax=Mesomycoplasma lagogenitalium TaxID=171286 RepID=A0ABY8LTR5_9BACT|nr:PTS sugar transporter subunit IIA [Mesomycoplasma lagogenitalium]WGI36629.1 PTS sugar transporter subunit IIA [Mesomycoplasma lagogenitalium]
MLDKKSIYLNVDLKNKKEIFEFVFDKFKSQNSVTDQYLNSMIQRDKESSVAIGNYLFLPHGNFDCSPFVLKNNIIFVSLKDIIKIDNQLIKFVVALALKPENQMEAIGNIGIAFSDEDEVKKLVNKKELTIDDILSFLNL